MEPGTYRICRTGPMGETEEDGAQEEGPSLSLMDVLKKTRLLVQNLNPTQNKVLDQIGSCDLRADLKRYVPSSLAAGSEGRRAALRDYRFRTSPSPQTVTETPERPADDSSSRAISLTPCGTKHVSSWSLPEASDKSDFSMTEPAGMTSRTSLEALSTAMSPSLKMSDIKGQYEACTMSINETANYGEQLLPDQLLGFSMLESQTAEKKAADKTDSVPDQTSKHMYEGLLLEKCNGEDGLLSSSNQDWGYIESFIREGKMELLDLCSKNELSVNLFSEDDVDNHMFDDNDDDDDDSTLSGDLCSLKIRYESFQDNMREKTNVLHEETQFSFFPSVIVNCAKAESNEAEGKPEDFALESEGKAEGREGSLDRTSDYRPKLNYFIDSTNSAEESDQESDDSSSGSVDAFRESKHRDSFSLKNIYSSSSLSYGLRAKRKVRFSDDYLYDVDSSEGEKREQASGLKEEQDDDWRPKKRRKSSRKETAAIIKCIILNRVKGEKLMCVKLARIDPAVTTVILNQDSMGKYEKLAPLKGFWNREQLNLAAEDKHSFHRLFGSSPAKRKHKHAHRLRIQRIQSVEAGHAINETLMTETSETSDPNDVVHRVTKKSRTQEMEEKRMRHKTFKIRKFKSEARMRELQITKSMTNQTDASALEENKDAVGGEKQTESESETQSPLKDEDKMVFTSFTCFSNKATESEGVSTGMPVVPGGYLQTLLDASDSLSGSGVSFFPPRQQALDLSLEQQQFVSLQLAQSCVLSPPSESELQQSPQNCPSLSQMWHSQLSSNQQFAPEASMLNNTFSNALPTENLAVPGFSQLGLSTTRMIYVPEQVPPQADAGFPVCLVQRQFQRLHSDGRQLSSFDSLSSCSLSASSSNYSSVSLKSDVKHSEDDVNENFLSHCSSKMVIQQSIEAIAPLRESTDLLDISNFTPDKFRHVSLSAELSPPETPNLSPQVTGREARTGGKELVIQNATEMNVEENQEMKWNCNLTEQRQLIGFTGNTQQYQLHDFKNDDVLYLENKKELNPADGNKPAEDLIDECKGSKSKKKSGNKQAKKIKSSKPRAPKVEKVKVPRQNSRASKKLKSLLGEKSGKVQMQKSKQLEYCSYEDWPGTETIGQSDEQREFEEPSNILSNIVSGMAEVQRFMMASIEPIWGPAPNICLPSEANKLSLKTLKILSGTTSEPKKKSAAPSGGTKSRTGGGKAAKNQAKFNPFCPHLALNCNVFDKRNLCIPGINGPAHKKMYRHKTSAKFPRVENLKGKQAERDPNKDVTLMSSFEKLR